MENKIDQTGQHVKLINAFPKRIVSLVPSQTELIFYLGGTDKVIGVTKFCVHPNKARNKKVVGGTKRVNIKDLKMLNPDLIIANKEENEKEDILALKKNYAVWVSDVRRLDHALEMISSVGDLIHYEENAKKLCEEIKTVFNELEIIVGRNANGSKPKVAYFIWKEPFMVAGQDTFINDMIERCGWQNCFSNSEDRYPSPTSDEIMAANPDIILLSSEPFPFREMHIEAFATLCPNAEIKLVDGEMFSWYGSRLLQAAAYFQTLI